MHTFTRSTFHGLPQAERSPARESKFRIHHLKARWLLVAMALAVAVGETIGYFVTKAFDLRFPTVAIGAVCVGLVALVVSWLYDGSE